MFISELCSFIDVTNAEFGVYFLNPCSSSSELAVSGYNWFPYECKLSLLRNALTLWFLTDLMSV